MVLAPESRGGFSGQKTAQHKSRTMRSNHFGEILRSDIMKKPIAILFALTFVVSACTLLTSNSPTPIVIVVTATNQPMQASPTPTNTPTLTPSSTPTETLSPTPTLTPSSTPTETPSPTPPPSPTSTSEPVTVADFEALLQNYGYSREPFKGIGNYTDLRPGKTGYVYSADNVYEPIVVYTDGYVRLEVLNDRSSRASHMEKKLEMLDEIFPAEFMAELRQANDTYLETAPKSVTGDPAQLWPPPKEDFWSSIEGQYNVSNTTIDSYPVAFSLWFWQIECPSGYICWFPTFAGQVFLGQSSFVFYNIEINIAP